MNNYTFFEDPGHGWLEVDREELRKLGIEEDITGWSYQKGNKVYLEEDQDLSTFLKAKFPVSPANRSQFLNSQDVRKVYQEHSPGHPSIRNYNSYEVTNA
jgi:hypothetical protein